MAKILSFNASRYKDKRNFYKKFFDSFQDFWHSLETFWKFSVIAVMLVAFVSMVSYGEYLQLKQQAASLQQTTDLLHQHFTGAFAIDTPSEVTAAAAVGAQLDVKYNQPPVPPGVTPPNGDTRLPPLGSALLTNNMKAVDSQLWTLMSKSRCFSTTDPCFPTLMAQMKQHLQEQQNNPLIVGYWLIDDYLGDFSAILPKVTSLIHQVTPGKPGICGFGATIKLKGAAPDSGISGKAISNFTPQGCDMVAFYLYPPSQQTNTPAPASLLGQSGFSILENPANVPNQGIFVTQPSDIKPSSAYDWTMSNVLPSMFDELKARGWNPANTPWIGIGDAWAGYRLDLLNNAHENFFQLIPTVQDMDTQALSYCQRGAMGVMVYGYEDSAAYIFPQTNYQIRDGVQKGFADCQAYWGVNPFPSGTPATSTTPILVPNAPLVTVGCEGQNNIVSDAQYSWNAIPGVSSYDVKYGYVGDPAIFTILNVRGTSVLIPASDPNRTRGGFSRQGKQVWVQVAVHGTNTFSKQTIFTTSVCPAQ